MWDFVKRADLVHDNNTYLVQQKQRELWSFWRVWESVILTPSSPSEEWLWEDAQKALVPSCGECLQVGENDGPWVCACWKDKDNHLADFWRAVAHLQHYPCFSNSKQIHLPHSHLCSSTLRSSSQGHQWLEPFQSFWWWPKQKGRGRWVVCL